MYLAGEEITVTWVLGPTDSPLLASDYDISITFPDLNGTYTNDGIINYVAPTATTAGSLQYKFTSSTVGRVRLSLTTGTAASHDVLDEKDFWIFAAAPTSAASLKVLAASARPGVKLFKTNTAAFNLDWRFIDAICQDAGDPNILWISGEHEFGDTKPSIARLDITDYSVTEYLDVITVPSGKLTDGIAVNESGRVVVTNRTPEPGAQYEAYYSDSPYTTWTKCTRHGSFPTTSAGVRGLKYDEELGSFVWLTQTRMAMSKDGITFTGQTFDNAGDDVLEVSNASVGFIDRMNIDNQNSFYSGTASLGGGAERFLIWNGVAPASWPEPWQNLNGNTDVFGSGHNTQNIVSVAPSLSLDSVWGVTATGLMIECTDGLTFAQGTIVDVSSQLTGNPTHLLTITDFGIMYLFCRHIGAWNIYESTDATTWTLSTDTRFTDYDMASAAGWADMKVTKYRDFSGIAWVDIIGNFEYDVVAVG